jgi:hypothetical protein
VLKKGILGALKVIAGAAAVVAIFVPVGTFNQVLIFFVSVAVIIGCLLASDAFDSDGQSASSIWPDIRSKRSQK